MVERKLYFGVEVEVIEVTPMWVQRATFPFVNDYSRQFENSWASLYKLGDCELDFHSSDFRF